jgi:hypothetical protein
MCFGVHKALALRPGCALENVGVNIKALITKIDISMRNNGINRG